MIALDGHPCVSSASYQPRQVEVITETKIYSTVDHHWQCDPQHHAVVISDSIQTAGHHILTCNAQYLHSKTAAMSSAVTFTC